MTSGIAKFSAAELPIGFQERMVEIFAERAGDVFAGMRHAQRPCFRVHTPRHRVDDVLAELRAVGIQPEAVPYCPDAFFCAHAEREALTHSAVAAAGRIYIQNAASLIPVLVLAPQPDDCVLDLAAAPGGKTLHIASRMHGRGMLSAVEKVKPRYFRLKENLRRFGEDFVRTFCMDGTWVKKKTPERFDRILLDAPCSSEARFLVGAPDTFSHWSERKITEMVRKQTRLLDAAIAATRPGGTIVYSTCSLAPEENEGVIDTMLRRHGSDIGLAPIDTVYPNSIAGLRSFRGRDFDPSIARALRVLPDENQHAFFVAKLVRAPHEALGSSANSVE